MNGIGPRPPLLRIEALSKSFASRHDNASFALCDLSLEVASGEFVALLGPSGCGKSTLLKLIAGFLEPSGGQILIDGAPMRGVPPERRPLNTVFQNYALFPHMTVAQNVGYGPRRAGVRKAALRQRIDEMLEMVGLTGFHGQYPNQLSGGQQQRVAIARALINGPKLLLLDEPLSALDLNLRRRMQYELKNLQRKAGIAFIFVTHDQEEAMAMADRIVVMHDGRIEQDGSPRAIYEHPATPFVAQFLGEANRLLARIDAQGNVEHDAHGTHGTHGSATVILRPEDITLHSQAPVDGRSYLPVTISSVSFLGESSALQTITDDAQTLLVKQSKHDTRQWQPGERAFVAWHACDAHRFEAGTA